ncbi:hypothetical protein GEMRC1_005860 [Eukaryota sp. GEM-RC1]
MNSQTLVLKRLPQGVTEQNLLKILQPFGTILSLKISGKSSDIAFIEFSDPSSVHNALATPIYLFNSPLIAEPFEPSSSRPSRLTKPDWVCSNCHNINFSKRKQCFSCASLPNGTQSVVKTSSYFTDTLVIHNAPSTTTHQDIHVFLKKQTSMECKAVVFSRQRNDALCRFSSAVEALRALRRLQEKSPKHVSDGVICPSVSGSKLMINGVSVSVCFARQPSSADQKISWEEAPEYLCDNMKEEEDEEEGEEPRDDSVDWIMDTFRDIAEDMGAPKKQEVQSAGKIPDGFYLDIHSNLYYLPNTFHLYDPYTSTYYQYSETKDDFIKVNPPTEEMISESKRSLGLLEDQSTYETVVPVSTTQSSIPSRWKGFPVLDLPRSSPDDYRDRAQERRDKGVVYTSGGRVERSRDDKPLSVNNRGRKLLQSIGFQGKMWVPKPKTSRDFLC